MSRPFFVGSNLVPRAHLPFGPHQDTELWNNCESVGRDCGQLFAGHVVGCRPMER